jgi:hypothetical protein
MDKTIYVTKALTVRKYKINQELQYESADKNSLPQGMVFQWLLVGSTVL